MVVPEAVVAERTALAGMSPGLKTCPNVIGILVKGVEEAVEMVTVVVPAA